MHGQGRQICDLGRQICEGQFQNDQFTGYGRTILATGDVYTGNFVNYAYHGFGVLITKSGEIRSGNWNQHYLETDYETKIKDGKWDRYKKEQQRKQKESEKDKES